MEKYVKKRVGAPSGFFEAEALGLKWLNVEGGPKIVKVFDYDENSLTIERVDSSFPTNEKAFDFGKKLAAMHGAPAPKFGFSPSKNAFFGPLDDPLPGVNKEFADFWSYFIDGRIKTIGSFAVKRGQISADELADALRFLEKLANKWDFLDKITPSKVHGDLWSGNLLWGENEAVLIDPSAHSGHFEEDLAMLRLFGCTNYHEIIEGYSAVRKLEEDFESRNALHNLYPILGHVAFFGRGYLGQFRQLLQDLRQYI